MNNDIALVIGVGSFQHLGLAYLKDNGFTVIGIDGNSNASGKVFCDKFYHIDLNEFDKILNVAKNEKVSFAIGFECDPAVEAINIVNESLGLNSLNEAARKASMDKLLVRKIQRILGLNCPDFFEIYSLDDLKKVHTSYDCDWVLKPMASSGSRGVELLNKNSDLELAYSRSVKFAKKDEPLLLEQFIHGQEIAIDGFSVNGECNILTISHKDRSEPPYLLDIGLLISSDVQSKLATEAKNQLSAIFNYLQSNLSSAYHAEFLHNENGVYLVEFSFRGAGFNVFSKLIPKVTGFNTLQFLVEQTRGLAKQWNHNTDCKTGLYLGFFDGKEGKLKNIEIPTDVKKNPNILELSIYAKPGDDTHLLRSGADRLGHIILLAASNDNLKEAFFNIKKQVKFIYES